MRSLPHYRLPGALRWALLLLVCLILTVPTAYADPPFQNEGPPVPVVPPHTDFQPPAGAAFLEDFVPPGLLLEHVTFPPGQPDLLLPVPPTGRALAVNERVGAMIESGTFAGPVQLHLSNPELPAPIITATQTVTGSLPTQALMRVQLEALDFPGGNPIESFPKPIRLIFDARSLLAEMDPGYKDFYLAYRDPDDATIWHEVPLTVYQSDGLVAAEVLHFSDWELGVRPERWSLAWNPPTVDAFSGAATFSYPIEVPPGRGGLEPSVRLSYNSNALNGRIHDLEADVVADGWSLSDIAVVRTGVKLRWGGGIPETYHPDTFRLMLTGSGHELLKESGGSSFSDILRYYVKDRPDLRVTRYYDPVALNQEGLFWIVDTADGTRYRLGYTADAEEWQHVNNGYHITVDGHQGNAPELNSAIAWWVDTVTDAHGNQMEYTYNTGTAHEDFNYFYDDVWNIMQMDTHENRIVKIRYNWRLRYTGGIPVPKNVGLPSATGGNVAATRIEFHAKNESVSGNATKPITSIYIFHGPGSNPMTEYRLASHGAVAESAVGGCDLGDYNPPRPRPTTTVVLDSIRRWAGTNANPDDDDTGYALPATTFQYTPLANFHRNDIACFRFHRLSSYANGYGGSVSFSYEHDGPGGTIHGRAHGDYQMMGSWWYHYPDVGYSYHVASVSTNDGRNPAVVVEYAYAAPCYSQLEAGLNGNWGVMAGATHCNFPDATDYGTVVGFADLTQTVRQYAGGAVVSVTKSRFYQNPLDRNGRLDWSESFAANGTTLLAKTDNDYATVSFGSTTFAYTSEELQISYNNGAGSPSVTTRTAYEYSTLFQGDGQYGNQTVVRDYGDEATAADNKTIIRCYYPNVDPVGSDQKWLVGYVGAERIFQGSPGLTSSLCSGTETSGLLRETRNFYDTNGVYNLKPTKGDLASTRVGKYGDTGLGGGESTNGLILSGSMTYDDSGNVTSRTSTSGAVTTIAYEDQFNLYPIQARLNPGGGVPLHFTTFAIYGFNNVPVDGFQKQAGLLKEVVDPNGVTTRYEYDPFGRLMTVFDGLSFAGFGDSDRWNDNPVELHRYWDNTWNDPTIFLNPAVNAPFFISTERRRGSYPAPPNSSGTFAYNDQTYYDGLGRPIQERSIWAAVYGQSLRREIITSTAYGPQGKPTCQTVPYDVAFYSDRGKTWPQSPFVTDACTAKPHTATTYDALGRPLVVTAPDGAQTQTVYYVFSLGQDGVFTNRSLTQVIDANQHVVNYFNSARGQLVEVRNYMGTNTPGDPWADYVHTAYGYDVMGNLTLVKTREPSSNGTGTVLSQVTMGYDALGRKTSMTDPDMGAWTYKYDGAGNLVRQFDAKGKAICFTYDALDRIKTKANDPTPATACPATPPTSGWDHLATYIYDTAAYGKGKLAQVKWGYYSNDNYDLFAYDSRGRLYQQQRWLQGGANTMTTTAFDAFDRPTAITYPNGEVVTYTYDREGENTLVAGGNSLVTDVAYTARGQLARQDRASGVKSFYTYYGQSDNFRLQSALTEKSSGVDLLNLTYIYDDVGNILTVNDTIAGDNQTFSYDALNRLERAAGTGPNPYSHNTEASDYDYDKLGNISNYAGTTYTYHATKKHAVTSAGSATYQYDANGNMTSRTEGGVTYTQVWDVENRLVQVTKSGSATVTSFKYDADGLRTQTNIETPSSSLTTIHAPFPNYEVERRYTWNGSTWALSAGPIYRSTYSLAGQVIATRVSGDPNAANNGLFYVHSDHLGSTAFLTTTSQNEKSGTRARYLPFGAFRTTPTATISDRGFTGHKHNNLGTNGVGLIYMNARYYVPGLARFASADTIVPDPMNPQSFNRYAYVNNSPLKLVDPTGHRECGEFDGELCGLGPPPPRPAPRPIPEPASEPQQLGLPLEGMVYTTNEYAPNPDLEDPYHNGRDATSSVTTDLRAVATGRVRVADRISDCTNPRSASCNFGTGNVVIIEYAYDVIPDNIRQSLGLVPGQSMYVQYQHLANIDESLQVGQEVHLGTLVGQYGQTGRGNGVDHLHLEVHIGPAEALGTGDSTTYDDVANATEWHGLRDIKDPKLIWP